MSFKRINFRMICPLARRAPRRKVEKRHIYAPASPSCCSMGSLSALGTISADKEW